MVTWVMVVSFMIAVPFALAPPLVGGLTPATNTTAPIRHRLPDFFRRIFRDAGRSAIRQRAMTRSPVCTARPSCTRRAGSTGTYDFAWTSHPASYGFTVGSNADWHPDRAELAEQIRSFLADIDPRTGYLRE